MEIIYSKEAEEDVKYWKKSENKTIQNKIPFAKIKLDNNHFRYSAGLRIKNPDKIFLPGFFIG